MRITIESTGELTRLDGVRVRHWTGISEKGVRCHVFTKAIVVHDQADASQFESELEIANPPAELTPIHHILMEN